MAAAVLAELNPGEYQPHALHGVERAWPETNCYVDLWIEILASLRLPPEAALAFTVMQDFEGDQIGFFKFPIDDLETLFGFQVLELAIFDRLEPHVATQIERGRLCLVEVDSFFLPDTRGLSYRIEHGKTTIGINRLDRATRRLEYFHNGGYFALEGEDFDGLFRRGAYAQLETFFLPYTEFVKFDRLIRRDDLVEASVAILRRRLALVPKSNPIAAFAATFPDQARNICERPEGFFHKYAFNTLRQLGANFGLLSDYLLWLNAHGERGVEFAAIGAALISDTAKSVQFQLARAVAKRKFETLGPLLEPACASWDALIGDLSRIYGA